MLYRLKKTGTVLKTGTITGTETPYGYDLAATDFLTEARVRRARPKERPYKLRDGGGLYLLITPTDAKQWRLRYVIGGRESMLSLGSYPATSLKAARAKRTELRAALEAGKDPAVFNHGTSTVPVGSTASCSTPTCCVPQSA